MAGRSSPPPLLSIFGIRKGVDIEFAKKVENSRLRQKYAVVSIPLLLVCSALPSANAAENER